MLEFWASVLPIALLLALGYGIGSLRERQHLKSLAIREAGLSDISLNTLRFVTHPETVERAIFVCGTSVIATDYFKVFAAQLRKIIGGELRTFETLMDRARRESTLRMLEEARACGATEVWSLRYDSANVLKATRNNPAVSVELFAYGTAIVRRRESA